MDFVELKVTCPSEWTDVLIAELGEMGFDSFMETEQGFQAYVEKDRFDSRNVDELVARYADMVEMGVETQTVARENWNEEWEKNYEPIRVEDQILVRAQFHPAEPEVPYQIIITPKMSFGTGHHATTWQMLRWLLRLDMQGKRVLDAGSGTGILAIMAALRGATEVVAYDIDDWCLENGRENVEMNGLQQVVEVKQGTIFTAGVEGIFDVILANINKNVLLDEMHAYEKHLAPGGFLLLSGFYTEDIADLQMHAEGLGLQKVEVSERERWASLVLKK
jgi:ribosomal protein L11 methyltransferase